MGLKIEFYTQETDCNGNLVKTPKIFMVKDVEIDWQHNQQLNGNDICNISSKLKDEFQQLRRGFQDKGEVQQVMLEKCEPISADDHQTRHMVTKFPLYLRNTEFVDSQHYHEKYAELTDEEKIIYEAKARSEKGSYIGVNVRCSGILESEIFHVREALESEESKLLKLSQLTDTQGNPHIEKFFSPQDNDNRGLIYHCGILSTPRKPNMEECVNFALARMKGFCQKLSQKLNEPRVVEKFSTDINKSRQRTQEELLQAKKDAAKKQREALLSRLDCVIPEMQYGDDVHQIGQIGANANTDMSHANSCSNGLDESTQQRGGAFNY